MKLTQAVFGLSSFFSATCVYAAPVKVEVDVGGEYHFAAVNTDDGLNLDAAQHKETDFVTRAAKLALRGKLNENLTWGVLYQLDTSRLERYWLNNKINEKFEVSIGQQKIKVYGWHRRLSSSAISPVRGAILNSNPLTDKLSVDFVYKVAGTVSLSLVKDYFDPAAGCTADGTGCTSWNGRDVQKQPAIAFEWVGDFNGIQPLVQYASYDRGHSSTASVGVRYKSEVIDTYLDYTMDTRNDKGADPVSGEAEDQEEKYSGIVLYGEYFLGSFTPYLHVSTLDVEQYTGPGVSQPKTNTNGALDDNEQLVSIGAFYDGYGALYRPYLGVALTQGKYVDPDNTADEETRSKTDILLGLTGKF